MQFKVPQDVQREDTILGPITLRQLFILMAGGGVDYIIYVSLAKTYFVEVWLPPVAIVGALTLAFAFLKLYSLPFHIFLMNFIEYHLLPKKRTWIQGCDSPYQSIFSKTAKKPEKEVIKQVETKPKKSLAELSKILDMHGKPETEEVKKPIIKKKKTKKKLSEYEKKQKLNELINHNYK